jgi:transposase
LARRERQESSLAVAGAPPLSARERVALDHDYRYDPDPLVRRRSQIVLLAGELETQSEVARVIRCSPDTVRRTLALYQQGGRSRLRRTPALAWHTAKRTLIWQKALATALARGPEACGVARPTWTAPLLAQYLAAQTGITVDEATVRRGLASLDYVCRRPVWTVRHKAEEQADYLPKKRGSKRC